MSDQPQTPPLPIQPVTLIQPQVNFSAVPPEVAKVPSKGPKKKILMLSDHPLSTSGVGVQARYLITGLIQTGKWSFRCFGGAVKHDNYNTIKVNDDFVIKPTNGFG